MIKLLQQEAQCYFQNRTNILQAYQDLQQRSHRVHFFLMLLYNNPSLEYPITFISEAAASAKIDLLPLLTAIWAYSLHLQPSGEQAKKLFGLVAQLSGRNLVQKSYLLSQLPEWVNQGAGLIESQAFDKRIKRVYTKINYEQSKHALMRQSNEGYAKLILLLSGLKDSHDSVVIWKKILSLIGNFDLDPDRVLDLIVEGRIQNSEARHFLVLLKNFRRDSVVLTVGNKLRSEKEKPDAGGEILSEKKVYCGPPECFDGADMFQLFRQIPFLPNPRLCGLAAQCIKNDLFSYTDLLPYLGPSDSFLRRASGKKFELTLQKISKSFTLSMVEIDEQEQAKITSQENLEFEGQLLHSSKLAVITELVKNNDWADFSSLWAGFKNKFDLVLYQPLLHALLDLFEWVIEPLVVPVSFQGFFRVQKKSKFFVSEGSPKQLLRLESLDVDSIQKINELIGYIGRYLSFRPRVFIKLCRIFKSVVKDGDMNGELVAGIKQIIKTVLVPANSYAENNGTIALQLYSLLECFPYQYRYECYLLVYREAMTSNSYVARIFESIKRRQNIIVNNLSKENKKLFIRKITKLMHNQALPVLYWIARRIVMEDYEAVVPEIVAVLNNATPLTLDMTIFVMLYTLNEHKEGMVNIKTHQFQPWFKNVITFISTFFRKYLEADIQPVFDYIFLKTALPFSQLEDQDQLPGALLKLLHSILNKMHGSVMIEEVNKTKLDAIAAGPKLQAEILQLSSEVRAAKKSKVMLQKFFWEQNMEHLCGRSLAFNLLVLLIQKRAELLTKAFIDDLRIVADIYDEFTLLIVQIVRVLLYQAQDYSHYGMLMPEKPLKLLLLEYKIPLELACQMVRPGIKHIATMSESQWVALVSEFTECYSGCLKDPRYLLKTSRPNQRVQGYLNAFKLRVLEFLSPTFFTTFWFLTIDSVYFPAKSYAEKIDDVRKKLDQCMSRRNDKETDRMKTLLEKLMKEEEQQRRKYQDTISEENLKKLEVDVLKGDKDKEKKQKENGLFLFAEAFVQICLLPRMMLDRAEALYCVKFTTEMIKANKMPATKSIRLITLIIEYVMNYLPFTTHREANNCISVFLSQILSIFINWSDSVKLKQDLKKILGVEETPGKDNYPKLRDYLVRLFERVGNIVKSIKEEPYIIKNCLYLLEKVESIPGYKQQADELIEHMNELKQAYTAVDMRTILDRQMAILAVKKNDLPQKPQDRKVDDKKQGAKPSQQKQVLKDVPKQVVAQTEKKKESVNREVPKENPKISQTKSPLVPYSSAKNNNDASVPRMAPQLIASRPNESTPTVSTVTQQGGGRQGQFSTSQPRGESVTDEMRKRNEGARYKEKSEDRGKYRDNRFNETSQGQQKSTADRPESRFSDRPPEKKNQPKDKAFEPKIVQQKLEGSKMTEEKPALLPIPVVPVVSVQQQVKQQKQGQSKGSQGMISSIPPPKRLSDVKREMQGFTSQSAQGSQLKDNSSKPKQQELKKGTTDNTSKNQKPISSISVDPSLPVNPVEVQKQQMPVNLEQSKQKDKEVERDPKVDQNRENSKQFKKEDSHDRGLSKDRIIMKDTKPEEKVQGERVERKREQSQHQESRKDNRWSKDDGKRWDSNRPKDYYNREQRSQPRQMRKQEKRERQRQREKDKDRQKKHDKYRSRSREKYGGRR